MKEISTDFIEDILDDTQKVAQEKLNKKYPTAGFKITAKPDGNVVIVDKTGRVAIQLGKHKFR